MKKILLLDVDEVICFAGFLRLVNEFLHTDYKIDDITDYYIDEALIPKDRFAEFIQFTKGKNLYENAYILPGAIEVIKKLYEEYDLYILSSCVNPFDYEGSGQVFADKYNFLRENLPFIEPERFIFTSSKQLIKADIKIDDSLSNLKDDTPLKLLFPSYHNKGITDEELKRYGVIRAGFDWRNGWEEVEKILIPRRVRK